MSDLWGKVDAVRRASALFEEVLPAQPPDSFTVSEYAQRYDLGENAASRQIEKLKRAGLLQSARIKRGKNYVRVYWLAEQSKPSPGRRR